MKRVLLALLVIFLVINIVQVEWVSTYKQHFYVDEAYCKSKGELNPVFKERVDGQHKTVNVAGYQVHLPKNFFISGKTEGNYNKSCSTAVHLVLHHAVLIGTDITPKIPDNTHVVVGISKHKHGRSTARHKQADVKYDEKFDLQFYINPITKKSNFLTGKLAPHERVTKEAKQTGEVRFICYDDPRNTNFSNCSTVEQIHPDITLEITLQTEHLMHWRDIYLFITNMFIK